MSDEPPKFHPITVKRSRARLAAVQALYQIELTGARPDTVIAELREHGEGEEGFGETDEALLADIVRGVMSHRPDLDAALDQALAPDWNLARLEIILRAVLRAGAYELEARLEIPVRVVLNEYVDIAHAFFAGKEPRLVNGVLDRLAHRLRPHELGGRDGETAPSR